MSDVRAALDGVGAVADAVLFEGYLLYPYRASAQKNRVRWQWGVLTAAGYGAAWGEPSSCRAEFLVEPRPGAALHVRLRFLQVQARSLRDAAGAPVDELLVDGVRHFRWDEGVPRSVDVTLPVADLVGGHTVALDVPGGETAEPLGQGTLVRTCRPLTGRLVLTAVEIPGPYAAARLAVEVHNDADGSADQARDDALRSAFVGTHAVLAIDPGSFVSMTDGPQWAAPYVAECRSEHLWPVLAGPPDRDDLMLCTPIILADHPELAPESTIDLFDGTENDEILTLRTLVLTDEEKREARATDPRSAGIIDAVDAMPPEILERLHGAIRSMRPAGGDSPSEVPPERLPWWDPAAEAEVDPETDTVLLGDTRVGKGCAVVLRPGRGGDVQDAFLVGMRATVQAVVHDVDGQVHLAVSLDDDPAAELQLAHGRFRYFRPDEVEVAPS